MTPIMGATVGGMGSSLTAAFRTLGWVRHSTMLSAAVSAHGAKQLISENAGLHAIDKMTGL